MNTHSVHYYDAQKKEVMHRAAVFYGWFSEDHAKNYAAKIAQNLADKEQIYYKPHAYQTQLGLVFIAQYSMFGSIVKKEEETDV